MQCILDFSAWIQLETQMEECGLGDPQEKQGLPSEAPWKACKVKILLAPIRKRVLSPHPHPRMLLALTLLVYLAMSAATSAEAVAMGRSALTEDARVLVDPELVTRGDD